MASDVDRELRDAPAAAVLIVYRSDGSALTSPVWFRSDGKMVEIVIAEGDAKLDRLRADPRCVFMAFETTPPFGGLQIEGNAALSNEGVREARLAISSRYLGEADGRRYVEERTKPGVVVRLSLTGARRWDLRSDLPRLAGRPSAIPQRLGPCTPSRDSDDRVDSCAFGAGRRTGGPASTRSTSAMSACSGSSASASSHSSAGPHATAIHRSDRMTGDNPTDAQRRLSTLQPTRMEA